jgi:hypothetical protein
VVDVLEPTTVLPHTLWPNSSSTRWEREVSALQCGIRYMITLREPSYQPSIHYIAPPLQASSEHRMAIPPSDRSPLCPLPTISAPDMSGLPHSPHCSQKIHWEPLRSLLPEIASLPIFGQPGYPHPIMPSARPSQADNDLHS